MPASFKKYDAAAYLAITDTLIVSVFDVAGQSRLTGVHVAAIQEAVQIHNEPDDLPDEAQRDVALLCRRARSIRAKIIGNQIKPKALAPFSIILFKGCSGRRLIFAAGCVTHGRTHARR